jgi:hypothetical protein
MSQLMALLEAIKITLDNREELVVDLSTEMVERDLQVEQMSNEIQELEELVGTCGGQISPGSTRRKKRPHERPRGPIIRKVILLVGLEERPVRQINTRPGQCKPSRPNSIRIVIAAVTLPSRAGAPYIGTG